MNWMFRHLLAVPLLALAACAGQEATRTGFLSSDYDKLQPTKEHPEDLIYVSPAYVPANYTKAVIEPVAWRRQRRQRTSGRPRQESGPGPCQEAHRRAGWVHRRPD